MNNAMKGSILAGSIGAAVFLTAAAPASSSAASSSTSSTATCYENPQPAPQTDGSHIHIHDSFPCGGGGTAVGQCIGGWTESGGEWSSTNCKMSGSSIDNMLVTGIVTPDGGTPPNGWYQDLGETGSPK